MSISLVDVNAGDQVATEDECTFANFWALYPRRVARKDAERAWLKLAPAQRVQAIVAIVDWRRVWADKDMDYLPHAATWLNGWRFRGRGADLLHPVGPGAQTRSDARKQP